MARTSRRTTYSRGNDRKFIWAREAGSVTVATGTFSNQHLMTDFETQLGAQLPGVTVTTIRGHILLTEGTAPATQVGYVSMGIRTYQQNPDISAVANANSEHADWMAWNSVPLDFNSGAVEVAHAYRWEVQAKSQRKMEELGESLMLSVANNVTGMAILAQWNLSIGLKLP